MNIQEFRNKIKLMREIQRPAGIPIIIEVTPIDPIARLKAQLAATDYKVIKCAEYYMAGIDPPYNIVILNEERQAIRDQINELEQ